MVETPQDVGKEEEVSELWTELEEPQQQPQQQRQEERPPQPQPEAEHHELSQPKAPVGEVEWEAAASLPDAPAEASASGVLLPP
jgi:transposase